MNLRLFKCPSCGHLMRLGGTRCRRCYAEKPLLYSVPFLGFVGFMAGLLLVAYLAFWAISNVATT